MPNHRRCGPRAADLPRQRCGCRRRRATCAAPMQCLCPRKDLRPQPRRLRDTLAPRRLLSGLGWGVGRVLPSERWPQWGRVDLPAHPQVHFCRANHLRGAVPHGRWSSAALRSSASLPAPSGRPASARLAVDSATEEPLSPASLMMDSSSESSPSQVTTIEGSASPRAAGPDRRTGLKTPGERTMSVITRENQAASSSSSAR